MGDRMEDTGRAERAVAPGVAEAVQAHGFSTLRVLRESEAVIEIGPQNRPVPIHSIRKSILSSLFGPLIGRGEVQLSTTLAELGLDDFPGLTEHERAVTLRHLLTASSGVYLPLQDGAGSYDIFRDAPSEWPMRGSAAPGARFHYSNWDFNILGEVYQRVSGLPIFTALDGILAQPLGFRDWRPLEHARLHYSHDTLGEQRDTQTTPSNCRPEIWQGSDSCTSTAECGTDPRFCRQSGSRKAPAPTFEPVCRDHSTLTATSGGPLTAVTQPACRLGASRQLA